MENKDKNQTDKIMEGLEIAYKKMIEFKKYKKTPIITMKDGKVVEISPEEASTDGNVYLK